MAFPQVVSCTVTTDATTGTTKTAYYPATVNADNLLIISAVWEYDVFVTQFPAGTDTMASDVRTTYRHRRIKKATGSEGGGTAIFQCTTGLPCTMAILEIGPWQGSIVQGTGWDQTASASSAINSTATFGSVTMTSSDILWIAEIATGDDDQLITVGPSGYTEQCNAVSGGGTGIGSGLAFYTRPVAAASETPGNATIAALQAWITETIGVYPGSSGVGPPDSSIPIFQSYYRMIAGT